MLIVRCSPCRCYRLF